MAWVILLNLVTAASQFIIIAIINQKLGKEVLGIWSLVVAATAVGQISGFGLSNGLIRYLPEFFINKEFDKAEDMVSTVNVSNLFFSLPLIVVLYFPVMIYADHLLKGIQLDIFNDVIIWMLISLFINNLFSVYSFLFDAMQKYSIRCIIQIAGWILFVILSIILLPSYGLKAIGIANVIQSIFQFIVARIIVFRMKIFKRSFLFRFDKASFKQSFSFGAKFQFISVLVIFFDPLVKFFITKGIGLTGTANYELANKIAIQGRHIIVGAKQVIVPQVVKHRADDTLDPYFTTVLKKNLLISLLTGGAILIFSPLAIIVFVGHFDKTLLLCVVIVNIGWVSNIMTSIHYYTCMAIDKLSNLIVLHFMYSAISVIGFFILFKTGINTYTAIAVPSIALFIGSIYNSAVLSNIKTSFSWISSKEFIYFMLVSLAMLLIPFSTLWTAVLISLFFVVGFLVLFGGSLKKQLMTKPV